MESENRENKADSSNLNDRYFIVLSRRASTPLT